MLRIKRICLQLCAGLKHMHSLEPPYAHNDVKPGNVLLTHRKGQSPLAILMDFGSARPARKEIRSRSEALQLQVLGLLTFFFSFSEWCSFSSCFSSTVNVLSVCANSHCYPQGILDKLNMQFTTWSICCFCLILVFPVLSCPRNGPLSTAQLPTELPSYGIAQAMQILMKELIFGHWDALYTQ